ncbi:triose-phosphate isomerase [Acidipropionibacterium thoenii]|uniref:triose-phosphate isomerase n=1 Tax=Acidipropionibacterium thoenii TaxID=1751 RepID=UPI00040B3AEE|nr:triose-phosphate isomerase [Acidipropionibacterium thoenii]
MNRVIEAPFLIINPKAYLYGDQALELAQLADGLSQDFGVDIMFTVQHADIRLVSEQTERLIVTAQHMDPINPGRGMGHILPESLVAAGARAVVLNHAEHPLTLAELDAALMRAREVGLATVVCADSIAQCRVVAQLGPDVMICEPSSNIGTGSLTTDDYIRDSTAAVKEVNPAIMVLQGAGVSTGEDVARVLALGADASGGTSGIVCAPDWRSTISDMLTALRAEKDRRNRLLDATPNPHIASTVQKDLHSK